MIQIIAYLTTLIVVTYFDIEWYGNTRRENSDSFITLCLFATTKYKGRIIYPLYRFVQFLYVMMIARVLWYYLGWQIAVASIVPHFFVSFDMLYYLFTGKWSDLEQAKYTGGIPVWLNHWLGALCLKHFTVKKFVLLGSAGIVIGLLIILQPWI